MRERPRILVVDDEPDQRVGLPAMLEREGFAVETVADGRQALARVREGGVDLLLTDLRMVDLELRKAIERVVLLAEGPDITADALADRQATAPRLGGSLAGFTVEEVERQLILDTLERTRENRTQAARLLGISIRTLRNKLAIYRSQGLVGGDAEP
jgi:DNA-binding NtrC family response regulator